MSKSNPNTASNTTPNQPSSRKTIDQATLTSFGVLMSWAFPLFFGAIAPWLFNHELQWWTLSISLVSLPLALLAPQLLYFPYRAWMFIGGIIGFINTRIILGLTFYLMIFPIGMVLRIFNKLQFKKKNHRCSNYIIRTDKITKEQLENPF